MGVGCSARFSGRCSYCTGWRRLYSLSRRGGRAIPSSPSRRSSALQKAIFVCFTGVYEGRGHQPNMMALCLVDGEHELVAVALADETKPYADNLDWTVGGVAGQDIKD